MPVPPRASPERLGSRPSPGRSPPITLSWSAKLSPLQRLWAAVPGSPQRHLRPPTTAPHRPPSAWGVSFPRRRRGRSLHRGGTDNLGSGEGSLGSGAGRPSVRPFALVDLRSPGDSLPRPRAHDSEWTPMTHEHTNSRDALRPFLTVLDGTPVPLAELVAGGRRMAA